MRFSVFSTKSPFKKTHPSAVPGPFWPNLLAKKGLELQRGAVFDCFLLVFYADHEGLGVLWQVRFAEWALAGGTSRRGSCIHVTCQVLAMVLVRFATPCKQGCAADSKRCAGTAAHHHGAGAGAGAGAGIGAGAGVGAGAGAYYYYYCYYYCEYYY